MILASVGLDNCTCCLYFLRCTFVCNMRSRLSIINNARVAYMTDTKEIDKKSSQNTSEHQSFEKLLPEKSADTSARNVENSDAILLNNYSDTGRVEGEIDLNMKVSDDIEILVDTSNKENADISNLQRGTSGGTSDTVKVINLLSSKVEGLIDMFEHKLAYDITKQQQIDGLHSELQKYKSDLISKTSWPIINGLIQMYAFNNKRIIKMDDKKDNYFKRENFKKEITSFQEDIEILLEQNGVLAFRDSEVTGEFLPQKQRALETTKTSDKLLQGKIAKLIRPGFEQGKKIIQKEFVNVYVYDGTMTKPEKQSVDDITGESSNLSNDNPEISDVGNI